MNLFNKIKKEKFDMECPICGNITFNSKDFKYNICKECDWEYDEIEIKDKSICGANPVSFNKYKEIYKEIKTKKPNFSCRNKKDKELIRKMLKKTN